MKKVLLGVVLILSVTLIVLGYLQGGTIWEVINNKVHPSGSSVNNTSTIQCKDVEYGNDLYFENTAALAKEANMDGLNRYHESFVSILCGFTEGDPNSDVDAGFITKEDAIALAKALGKKFEPTRSEQGYLYQYAYEKLSKQSVCNACAANAAAIYSKDPKGKLALVIDAAMKGDEDALDVVRSMSSPPDKE